MLQLPLEGERVRLELDGEGSARIIRLADGKPTGHVHWEQHDDTLFVRELCIDAPHRGFGLGSESARLLIAAAQQGGWRTLRAWAPPDLGLATYFWSRMGLRPLFGEGPYGGIWFERRLRVGD